MTQLEIEKEAEKAANNHEAFTNFMWGAAPPDREHWAIYHTENRQSDILTKANAQIIAQRLKPWIESGDIQEEHFTDWLCGWVDGYSIRVYRQNKTITEAFKAWLSIAEEIKNYPILDEELFSRMEYEAALENIRLQVEEEINQEQAVKIYGWLEENYPREIENVDGDGAYPHKEKIQEAMTALKIS